MIATHSQGGLILQRFLTWMLHQGRGRELARIRSIVTLACPNGGSEYLRSLRHVLGFGRHAHGDLEVLNRQIADTQRSVLKAHRQRNCCRRPPLPHPVPRLRREFGTKVVTAASAQGAFPEASTLAGNHFSILDPTAPGNRTAQTVKYHILADSAANLAQPFQQITAVDAAAGSASAPLAAEAQAASEKFRIDVQGGQGVQIGDRNIQHNTFTAPAAQPASGRWRPRRRSRRLRRQWGRRRQ